MSCPRMFRASKLLLVGALTVFSLAASGAASAVTLAPYSSFSSSGLLLTGARALDGEPVGMDSIRINADGNDISPDGTAEADLFEGRLFNAGFDVFVYGEIYAFENVSGDPLLASFRVDRHAEAEAVENRDGSEARGHVPRVAVTE